MRPTPPRAATGRDDEPGTEYERGREDERFERERITDDVRASESERERR